MLENTSIQDHLQVNYLFYDDIGVFEPQRQAGHEANLTSECFESEMGKFLFSKTLFRR
jgi:hypothetical protein